MSIHCNLEPTNGSCITTESQPEGVSMVHFPLTKSTVRESTVRVSNATGGASLQRPSSGNDCLPAGNDDTQTSRRQLIFFGYYAANVRLSRPCHSLAIITADQLALPLDRYATAVVVWGLDVPTSPPRCLLHTLIWR